MQYYFLIPLAFVWAIPLVLLLKGSYGTKDKVTDKTASIEKKLDRIIELLEKDKGV
ncbi:DUF4083 family protein [Paenibacillus sp. VTT E-133280]|uniref:DUF4083 family protein n=1 Tax=Paenibacillus sp. VTT E-133280 TaxID=1986222 RepID=UPI00211AC5FA|nr:DUF4083 family protein [Paenibacillus sp. VTT E-133280]